MKKNNHKSILLFSKFSKFYLVGTSGLCLNYFISILFTNFDLWYIHANIIGILFSITTNFFLNKFWTFQEKISTLKKLFMQYSKYCIFSLLGAIIQLSIVFLLVSKFQILYIYGLVIAILIASLSNFILNRKFTFNKINN